MINEENNRYKALNTNWFNKNQKKLLWLINNKLTRKYFRKLLSINTDKTITDISVNRFSYTINSTDKAIEKETVFFVSFEISKRLYSKFKLFFWILHYIDSLFLDIVIPQYSFGLNTLVVIPDKDPTTNTVDGYIQHFVLGGSTWSAMRDASVGYTAVTNGANNIVPSIRTNNVSKWDSIIRGVFLFDTSSLGNDISISNAIFSMYVYQTPTDDYNDSLSLVSCNPASNTTLTADDYSCFTDTEYANSILLSTILINTTVSMPLTNYSIINKTGISKFGTRITSDVLNIEPTPLVSKQSRLAIYFSERITQELVPTLTITYSILKKPNINGCFQRFKIL